MAAGCASPEQAAWACTDGARSREGDGAWRLQTDRARDRATEATTVRGAPGALGAGEGEEERGGKRTAPTGE